LTSLIGREAETAAIHAQFVTNGARLLTLTGPGGVGKTRLALRVAVVAADAFADGVVVVPLAAIAAPELVLPTIARALGLREDGAHWLAASLVDALCDQRLLLVLDNVEQVREAGVDIVGLLAACPGVAALVTSRTPLRVAGEQRFPVAPLELPGAQDLSSLAAVASAAAVRLFVTRAQAVDPGFALDEDNAGAVVEICRRLDGLPLAIELAAARADLLSPSELLTRLDPALPLLTGGPGDAPVRLRTMRQAIAWSYDLLHPAAQALFRRLSVFVGGFTLETAEAMAGAGDGVTRWQGDGESVALSPCHPVTPSPSTLELVAALVDASLVRRTETGDGTRLEMLAVVREFARERLAAAGEAEAVARRHANVFLVLAEDVSGVALPGDSVAGLDRLAADHDNLRAAFDWLQGAGAGEDCLRLAAASAPFWFASGHLREGSARVRAALASAGTAPMAVRGRALLWAVELTLPMGHRQEAAALGEEAIALWRALGDRRGLAAALHASALIGEQQTKWEAAAALLEEELALRRALGEPLPLGLALILLGGVAYGQDDLPRAVGLVEEARALVRMAGNRRWTGLADWYLGLFAANEGRTAEAARRYRDSLCTLSEAEEIVCRFKPLVGLAAVAAESDCPAAAARLLGAADGLLRERGMELYPFDRPAHERAEGTSQACLGVEEFAALSAAGQILSREALLDEVDAVVAAAVARDECRRAPLRGCVAASTLTAREREVLALVTQGWSDKKIADALYISRRTASSHVAAIRAKLDAPSRAAAAAIAIRDRLV
jgi:non-specific serine/threonine protein kinase